MAKKEQLHLGQAVVVGAKKNKIGIIDGLTQTFAAVRLIGGEYKFYRYDEIMSIEDFGREEAEKWIEVLKGAEVPAHV